MDGTIGEIRMFGGTFAPAGWMLCQGQQLSLSDYQALYTIIGTTYGGDGQTSFLLPNISSRSVVGAGQGTGLSNYILGQVSGTEGVTLLQSQLPAHTHTPTIQTETVTPAATVTLSGTNTGGNGTTPAGSLYGTDNNLPLYATPGSATPVAMAANAVTINSFAGPLPTVTVGVAGSSLPHNNIQPYTAVNFIICVLGIYPSRN
ncbi:microcystin-dependent protein [Filimonas zeae]|uniref:Microcystin dependent MdpB family protein n=1 Tax=Filimonas zeae TaxID=1737353 RepID=A0A917MWU3_9BACT|nr:tail fiber protein [Filimonas zeae]MDR6340304.1 microcystin-dependent protein [Filimonas zeae]GGH72100.1 microcystin dependent MdpB family protein [Filimonas zeae]